MKQPKIAIVMGSSSDMKQVKGSIDLLKEFKVTPEVNVLSAHRSPKEVLRFASLAKERGIKVIIAAAGGSAALAGCIASSTTLPVIGIPIETKALKGLDSLLSTVQMPGGVPVASMAVGKSGAKNAAIFALEILGISDRIIAKKLLSYKKRLKKSIKLSPKR